ncbi:hypothetical protein THAOC_06493, partial [Thalassiosira oceanica]
CHPWLHHPAPITTTLAVRDADGDADGDPSIVDLVELIEPPMVTHASICGELFTGYAPDLMCIPRRLNADEQGVDARRHVAFRSGSPKNLRASRAVVTRILAHARFQTASTSLLTLQTCGGGLR